ncbi:hypothetical protein [Pontiella agarivorans]|uniref:Uncharacterized protein n=1 Tax=Pontiella agarivorans TaxID=3038953 RepID=A0ABU5MX66_9BACT|nr:hypothetical protein [Pontiella agarivorans]MDZ8118808.1 hypothetical protein [Pontiella agarivorans]
MNLRQRSLLYGISTLTVLLALLFLGGLIWSMVPMFGKTLPHHLAEYAGVSFKWSALLISSLLGVVYVGWIAASAVVHAIVTEKGRTGG